MREGTGASRIAGLDALRAISVLLVFAYHAPFTSGLGLFDGHNGVLLFFVISGYLITTLALRDLQIGQFSFAGFYLRRATRILPLYLVMFGVYAGAVAFIGTSIERSLFVDNWPLLVLPNADIAVAMNGTAVPYSIGWSIGVEEKFYLLWPLVLVFFRGYRRAIAIVAALIALLAAVASGLLFTSGLSDAARFAVAPYGAISAGILLACVRLPQRLPAPGWAFGLALAAFLAAGPLSAEGNSGVELEMLISVLSVILVAVVLVSAAVDSRHGLIRHLESRPLVYLGTRSYAIYLVQRVGIVAAHAITGRVELPPWVPDSIVSFAIALGLTLGLAELAHRTVERPVRAWGRRLAERFA